jgi:hypothetical protein
MAKRLYCWRCDKEVPMLEEQEWAMVQPLLDDSIKKIQQYRVQHGVSLDEALKHCHGQEVLAAYFELTGFLETDFSLLWHHRLSQYGPVCPHCGKPGRTPTSKHCVERNCPGPG